MRKYKQSVFGLVLLLAMMVAPSLTASAQNGFANSDFQATWQRTDALVGQPGVARGYYWGPVGTSKIKDETFNGKTLHVQYFDKSRMELNESAPVGNPYRVTNGLLANELISGNHQTGNTSFETRWPAVIDLASDADDANAPTYASFHGLTVNSNNLTGQSVVATIARDGSTGADNSKASVPGATITYYEPTTHHNIPGVFWNFLNQKGDIMVNGKVVKNQPLNTPWNYATGFPVTEAYWAKVKIAGQANTDVLIQAYERRVLTYVPSAPPAYRVAMGNIGQHYYDWLYNNAGQPAAQPTATPGPAQPTNTPGPAGPDCSGIPAPQSATVTPNCGSPGDTFTFSFFGFTPNEDISFWFTDPQGRVFGTARPLAGSPSGRYDNLHFPTDSSMDFGIWALTFHGSTSTHESIAWFKLVPKAGQAQPTPGPSGDVCSQVPASQNGSVTPTCGPGGTSFEFTGTGFTPNQEVRLWITTPDQAVVPSSAITADGHEIQAYSDNSGTVHIGLRTGSAINKGIWALTFHQLDGHHDSILYWGIK